MRNAFFGALKGIGVFESVWFDFKQQNDLFILLFKAALECSLHTYLRFLLIGSHRYAGNYCVLHSCLVFGVHRKKRHSLGGSTQDEYAFIFGQFAEPPERVRERNRIISRRRSLCFLNSNQGSEQKSAFVRMLNLACEHKEFGGSRLWKQY